MTNGLNEIIILKPHSLILKEAGVSVLKKVELNKNNSSKIINWFNKNRDQIKNSVNPNSFWADNTIFLKQGFIFSISKLAKKLEDFGYKKVFYVKAPLDYSLKGSIVDIFPINYERPIRIDFFTNTIEKIIEIKNNDLENFENLEEKIVFDKNLLKNLKKGDYLVHLDHGVGIYDNIETIENKKYFVLCYAQNDKLFVPIEKINKLVPYIGFSKPKISRLGGTLWFKTKEKAKEDIVALAKDLLNLYAQREISQRTLYSKDDLLIREFENSFEYNLTQSQSKVLFELKQKFETSANPIEALICGDVGFGKTEIALRLAFKSILEGYQVCLITPTTILADQHYNVALERFKKFPVKIELLSRTINKNSQRLILEDLENGNTELVIGTHRLLSNDVKFKKLGLLVIDEEQKFGVKQKEKIKQIKTNIDVLMLSATPIPRTLNLCLSGIKNIFTIEDPPSSRIPIKTIIKEFSWPLIEEAVRNELNRNGQVFFLHNRIESISKYYYKLRSLFPDLKIEILHSKLNDKSILKIIHDFRNRKIDILVATTIIQNGLDLKNANTLIVEDALKLGLADLHQLRGRVGRGRVNSYAYFFFKAKHLTEKSKLRLEYLKEYANLGDGYKLALRDLELRGAGNILGKEQSGVINKIGFNLYYEILNLTIEKLKNARQSSLK